MHVVCGVCVSMHVFMCVHLVDFVCGNLGHAYLHHIRCFGNHSTVCVC